MTDFDVDDPSPTPFSVDFPEANVTRIQVDAAEMAVGEVVTASLGFL